MSQNQTSRGNKIKVNKVDTFIQILIYLIVILFCLAILLPCLNVLVLSFNDGKDAARGGIWFWPRVFTLDNFKEVFKDGSIMTAYGISIARTVIGTFLSLMVTTLAGFALKQKDLPGQQADHCADYFHHAVQRRYDPHLYSVPESASFKFLLGICGSQSGKRYLLVDGENLFRGDSGQFGGIREAGRPADISRHICGSCFP